MADVGKGMARRKKPLPRTSHSTVNGNTIRIGREIQCLPHAGFFYGTLPKKLYKNGSGSPLNFFDITLNCPIYFAFPLCQLYSLFGDSFICRLVPRILRGRKEPIVIFACMLVSKL